MTLSIVWAPRTPGAPPGRLARWTRALANTTKTIAAAAVTPHRAALSRVRDMPLSLTGTALIDWASFHVNTGVGLLATGLSLWLVEHLLSDNDDPA
ncbi:MAG TPA: hypothetical protein VEO01_40485 [Pseudonocardiaceae bacterium]|nr:hypothetical protein [Pseudonocardiaceae bacterium]